VAVPDEEIPSRGGNLDPRECLPLLATQQIGRLVVAGNTPFVIPLNYVLQDGAILIRTDGGSVASRAAAGPAVFEVDQVHPTEHAGWSVVVHGPLEDVTDELDRDPERRPELDAWAPGPKDRWLRLVIEEVSGRWVWGKHLVRGTDDRGYL
jgi:nitroimidazol reductase NimA-like FMN-containing flavoprotein (pyridoxamine 5'-phosphate oxidase superfamily)